MNVWLGTNNTNFWDSTNWSTGELPYSFDEVVFDSRAARNCEQFGPSQGEMPGMGDGSYAKISLKSDFEHHVSLGADLKAYTLELAGGYLDQPGIQSHIEILTHFNWTGGSLNSTTHNSDLTLLNNSTATINPGVGNTLTSGSSLNLLSAALPGTGAVVNFLGGNLVLTNQAGISVQSYCSFKIDMKLAEAGFSGTATVGNPITISDGGQVRSSNFTIFH